MDLLANLLRIPTPDWVRRRALRRLFTLTAAAFEAQAPQIGGLDSEACLAAYARFSQAGAEQWLRSGRELGGLEQRLYRSAAEMGRSCRQWLRPGTLSDVMALGRVLYRMLDIDLQGDARGEVVINHCYFSRFYSHEVCRLMSAVDRGLFAGLSGGGDLTFSARITEGRPCCRAHLSFGPEAARLAEATEPGVTGATERIDQSSGGLAG